MESLLNQQIRRDSSRYTGYFENQKVSRNRFFREPDDDKPVISYDLIQIPSMSRIFFFDSAHITKGSGEPQGVILATGSIVIFYLYN